MKQDILLAIVRAHYRGDQERMRGLVLQAASQLKNERAKNELLTLANGGEALKQLPDATRNMVKQLEPGDLDELVLDDELRATLDEVLAEHQANGAFIGTGLAPRSRLLFHGPPGNGKTSAAAALCGSLNVPAYWLRLPEIVGSYLGTTAANLSKLLPILSGGVALVIDEIDSIGTARSGSEGSGASREYNSIVNAMLSLLDETHGGMLIATTNRVDMLDPALRRRFDLEAEFPAPSADDAKTLAVSLGLKWHVPWEWPLYDRFGNIVTSFDGVRKAMALKARRRIVEEWQKAKAAS